MHTYIYRMSARLLFNSNFSAPIEMYVRVYGTKTDDWNIAENPKPLLFFLGIKQSWVSYLIDYIQYGRLLIL
jgi:hypothetical protein